MSNPEPQTPAAPAPARMTQWINRLWGSSTANTWASLFTRSVSLVLVLPFVLRHFSEADVAVWFVFSAVLAVQGVLGFGFSPSFARLFSYARAGAAVEAMGDLRSGDPIATAGGCNWDSIARLFSCMRRIFSGLAMCSLLLLATLGTMAVWRPISHTGHRTDIWISWAVMVVGSSASFWNLTYVTYLQGMDHQAQWRRLETLLSLGSIFSSFMVLLSGGGLLALVAANQAWVFINQFAFRLLCRKLDPEHFPRLGPGSWDRRVFAVVWPSAWKSGLTNILTIGLIQSTGIMQAQIGDPKSTATYNLFLRIATLAGQIVQAPFMTKLPELARRRAVGDLAGQLAIIRRCMRSVHWSIVGLTVFVATVMPPALKLLHIQSVQFNPVLWALFSVNLLLERHGGMLQQIRNLTNRPLEHFGMVGYFCVNLGLVLLLHRQVGMYAFAGAMLGTQLIFALWFNVLVAYRTLKVNPWSFEATVSIPPFLVVLAWNVFAVCFR